MSTDSVFITNEGDNTLENKLNSLLKSTHNFDVLVGYFFVSGFYAIYEDLEDVEKVRILIGMNTNRKVSEIYHAVKNENNDNDFISPYARRKSYEKTLIEELNNSPDNKKVEQGILKFLEWLENDKLEIRIYPKQNIHAKVYIFTFNDKELKKGQVVTGSSNLTQAGLKTNLEFNVEVIRELDYDFAINKFKELWEEATPVDHKAVEVIKTKTWLSEEITPYELYLKFLYEKFHKELNITSSLRDQELPQNFKKYKYQEDAVNFAVEKLLTHGGVFISDVVGLGKTYMTLMLLKQIGGNTLIIAPPNLVEIKNPGSWRNLMTDFGIVGQAESYGNIEAILKTDHQKYNNIVVDEAHIFRSEGSKRYKALSEISRGKRVILVSATPYNNNPRDIYNLLKLFQNPRRSTLNNVVNLENFFNRRIKELENYKHEEFKEQQEVMKRISNEIRSKVLSELMLRRTRTEVSKYYQKDMEEQGLTFPDVEESKQLYYLLNEKENDIFNNTIRNISNLKLVRYAILDYLITSKADIEKPRGLTGFMKTTLIKRLESSFVAFKSSIDKQVNIYQNFIYNIEEHNKVYISHTHLDKVFDLIENEKEDELEDYLQQGKTVEHNANQFKQGFIRDLKADFEIFKQIQKEWSSIERDPKIEKLIEAFAENKILSNNNNKIIIFTEAVDTAKYLVKNLNAKIEGKVLLYTGSSSQKTRDEVLENFDDNIKESQQQDKYRVLVATEALSEGVNLHRACTVINYDIPWNPTRIMQRVGRVNRVNTKQNKIYTFSFLPSEEVEGQIMIRRIAEEKLAMFLNILGEDMIYLTEAVSTTSHELFEDITNPKDLAEVELETSFKYLMEIKSIKDNNKELFEKIRNLPKKARVAKLTNKSTEESLITFFRKGQRTRIISSSKKLLKGKELDFLTAVKLIKSNKTDKRCKISDEYFNMLDSNKEYFEEIERFYQSEINKISLNPTENAIINDINIIRNLSKKLKDEEIEFFDYVHDLIYYGDVPKHILGLLGKRIKNFKKDYGSVPYFIEIIKTTLPAIYFEENNALLEYEKSIIPEVVLSFELV